MCCPGFRWKRVFLLICEDAAPTKQQMRRSKYKWSLREPRQNRHMQYLLIFPSFPEENESGFGSWGMRGCCPNIQSERNACATLSVACGWLCKSHLLKHYFLISASILLFIGLFCFRATHGHISLLSFICSTYTVGIFTHRSHIYYIWTMSCTSFQSIQHQTRCWIVTDL